MNTGRPFISRFQLKVLACFCMFADHLCWGLFPYDRFASVIRDTIGRMAFPLFVFMLAEGFFHTRSRLRYCLNVLVTALISEIPYDLTFHHKLFYFSDQNVMFTLFLALVMFSVLSRLKNNIILHAAAAVPFAAAAYFLNLNYGLWGIACCFIAYETFFMPHYISGAIITLPLMIKYYSFGSLLSAIPLYFYDNSRGKIPAAAKYCFYAFFPVHILIIMLLKQLI